MKKIFALSLFALFCLMGFSQPYQIGHTTKNFTDASRGNRVIQTEIYYPASTAGTDVAIESGQFPVIVFGHGFVMVWSAYQDLWDTIVPRGYIMAFPRTEGNISPSHGEFGKDLRFLVGAMQTEGTTASSIFYNGVKNKSAIMGHSMGGGSSILAAANNTSIETVISLAPAETTPSAKAAGDSVTVDALIMAGSQDGVAPPAANAIPIYDTLNSSCKTYVSITGGAHCYFAMTNFNCDFGEGTSSTGISITRVQQQDVTLDLVNLWLDYKLKGNCNALSAFNDSVSLSPRITHQQLCTANPVPAITNNNGTLSSTPGAGYQWYLNGNAISSANSQQFTPTQNGNYSVEVTYSNGCSETSSPFAVSLVGTDDFRSIIGKFQIFPNPAKNQIEIYSEEISGGNVSVSILNNLGQTVKSVVVYSVKANFLHSIDIGDLPCGTYLIILEGKNSHFSNHFTKQ